MIHRILPIVLAGGLFLVTACQPATEPPASADTSLERVVQPRYVSDPVPHDSDDPAIWIHPSDPGKSLIVGTDKGDSSGGLYVFDLQGHLQDSVPNLYRPNNVDIQDGIIAGADTFAIAVCTERQRGQLRAFRLPDLQPVDEGGWPMMEGEDNRAVMGIGLYRRSSDGAVFAIVSRKTEDGAGADSAALWQYLLDPQLDGSLRASLVRRFGRFSGHKEIEAIYVDDAQGYVFYSDEQMGIRQYHADPDSGGQELAFFAQTGFAEDHEGISCYPTGPDSGILLISDQAAQRFRLYSRAGTEHRSLGIVKVAALESDGSETVPDSLNADFPRGLFVAMSDDRTFHLYDLRDLLPDLMK